MLASFGLGSPKFKQEYDEVYRLRARRRYKQVVKVAQSILAQDKGQEKAYRMILDLYLHRLKDKAAFEACFALYLENTDTRFKALYELRAERVFGSLEKWQNLLPNTDLSIDKSAQNEAHIYQVMTCFPLETVCEKLDHLNTHLSVIDQFDELTHYFAACFKQNKGLCYTRIGDGEGSLIGAYNGYCDDADLNEKIYIIMNKIMFGQQQLADSDWGRVISNLQNAYLAADIVKLPIKLRLEDSLRRSWRGYLGLASGIEFLYAHRDQLQNRHSVTDDLAKQLAQPDALDDLLALFPHVGVITCHADLEPKLLDKGAKSVKLHLIPQQVNALPLAQRATAPLLYPVRDREIIGEISKQDRPRLYFVAAGVLAKHYCSLLAQQGHIALDLGSAIDGWMGLNSRGRSKSYINKLKM